jgi:hypothetical protein
MWRDFFNALRELWEASRSAGAKHAVAFATVPIKPSRPIPRDIINQRVYRSNGGKYGAGLLALLQLSRTLA